MARGKVGKLMDSMASGLGSINDDFCIGMAKGITHRIISPPFSFPKLQTQQTNICKT